MTQPPTTSTTTNARACALFVIRLLGVEEHIKRLLNKMDGRLLKIAILTLVLCTTLYWKSADWIDTRLYYVEGPLRKAAQENSTTITNEAYLIRKTLAPHASDYLNLWNIHTDLKNYWLRVVSEMNKAPEDKADTDIKSYWLRVVSDTNKTPQDKAALEAINEGYAILMDEIETLMRASLQGRETSINEMKEYVRRKIEALQHPRDCRASRLLICDVRLDCGFGCWLHIVLNCFLTAFRDERVMIYKQSNFRYKSEWSDIFLPLTNCTDKDYNKADTAGSNPRVLVMTPGKKTTASWINWAIPTHFEKSLPQIHGHPFAWWIGQFTAYATRLNQEPAKYFLDMKSEIGFVHPIAGIHVRRDDKIRAKAARKFEVGEYMFFVEEWYRKITLRKNKMQRTVYVATDDATVLPELRRKYPEYKFISYPAHARKRYTSDGLHEIVMDVHALSSCDYLVCSQSSSVCRTAYEMMSYAKTDASTTFQGLDIPYGFKHFYPKPYMVNFPHSGSDTAAGRDLKPGNRFGIPRDPFQLVNDGYLRGKLANGEKFEIPAYKARAQLLLTNYSIFQ